VLLELGPDEIGVSEHGTVSFAYRLLSQYSAGKGRQPSVAITYLARPTGTYPVPTPDYV
jgi:hypothetical protein